MTASRQRWSAIVVLVGSLLGIAFSFVSTSDYVNHLDRQVHDIACSFIPGVTTTQGADEGCRTAMYSPYSALMRHEFWGGIPIALFAVGAFAFFAAFGLYTLLASERAPGRAGQFLGITGWTPLGVSVVMAVISAVKLNTFCKTCVGMYVASFVLAIGTITFWYEQRRRLRYEAANALRSAGSPPSGDRGGDGSAAGGAGPERPSAGPGRGLATGPGWLVAVWLAALGAFTLAPALVYARSLPKYDTYIGTCGTLKEEPKTPKDFPRLSRPGARIPTTLVVDPLCPTCKALHQRLHAEGFLAQLDILLVPFPLDNACNWMLDAPLHPGSCELSKALLCAEHRAGDVLDWAYEEQDALAETGKATAGVAALQNAIKARFPELAECMQDKETGRRLDRILRFAVDNQLPVSTPQLFVSGKRMCDEDSDLGLAYSLPKLAPELRVK